VLWEKVTDRTKHGKIDLKTRRNDYTYLQGNKDDEEFVSHVRNEAILGTKIGMESLYRFFQTYKKRGWEHDTLLIVTADHGKIFSKGKIWYGYHNDEEVARVPLLIHFKDLRGTDNRLLETIDITQTILEFFGIDEKLSESACSVLSRTKKNIVTTLTTSSKLRKERFLNVYESNHKYTFNIFNKQLNSFTVSEVKGFDEVLLGNPLRHLKSAGFNFKEIIKQHRLNVQVPSNFIH
jgi:membrane-anchored protein YejM (alkaline phosphatase superfamily)